MSCFRLLLLSLRQLHHHRSLARASKFVQNDCTWCELAVTRWRPLPEMSPLVVLPRPLGAFHPHCRRRRRWDSHSRLLQAPRFESERVTAWLHVLGSRVPYDQRCSAWRLCHSRLSRLDRCAVCRWYHRCLRSRLCVHFDHLVQHTISGDRSLGKTTVRQTASQAVDNPATRRVNTRYCSFRLTTPLPDR